MRHLFCTAALSILVAIVPARACRMYAKLDLQDIKYASVVIVGRVADYEIATDRGSYGRFRVVVDEVLLGHPPQPLTATWFNSTYGLPASVAEGPYLIALHEMNYPKPMMLTVLQAPCSSPFMFESASDEARAVRKMLAGKSN